jgi:hypothetical protein
MEGEGWPPEAVRAVGVEVQVLQAGTEAEIDAALVSLAQAASLCVRSSSHGIEA